MAFLIGMVALFCEAAVSKTITFRSLSFLGCFVWVISFDVFRDVLGLEGDVKAGIPTLAVKRGTRTATKVGAFMLPVAAIMSTIPYFTGVVGVAYIIPTALLGCILFYLALSLFTKPDVQNVKKQSQTLQKSVVLSLIAFIAAAFLPLI
jgi:4-hydroxybenzoate polyprenyltransferase